VLLGFLAAVVIAVAVLDLVGLGPASGHGPIGLAQVLAAHLTIGAFLLVPFALIRGARTLRLALVVLVIVAFVRFGGEWWSPPARAADGPTLEVATFNLEIQSRAAPDAVTFLRPMTADVIALQELTTTFADAIAADPRLAEAYPYQALYARDDVLGLGLLSRHPLADVAFQGDPSRLEAVVETPDGPIWVLDVHPLPARMPRGPLALPIGFDPVNRDAALGRIADDIDDALTRDVPVLVLGDINTAPTEPAFGRFVRGLRDAHAEVGEGPGWTYRPDLLEPFGIGLIRIDVVLMGPGLRPVTETTRCPPAGDHCAVIVTIGSD
jgi:endonuclease/exonuclease/phosphatase (EEP) superfamily protein YafD